VEQEQDGDFLDHDARYRRTDEYMGILRRTWTATEPFDYEGEFYRLKGASSQVHCFQRPHLPLFFGGASDIALEVGSRRADVFALWGEPRAAIRERVADIRSRAGEWDRNVEFSLSVRPILGETEALAWQRAEEILGRVQEATRGSIVPGQPARQQSVGSRRLLEFAAQGDLHDERLWMPVAAASGAAGSTTCLVGTPRQVAESLLAYHNLGCTTFIIRGFDPLNDAREYGRELIPLLRDMVAGRPSSVAYC
jgi:alkanesulfonate monooxygenase